MMKLASSEVRSNFSRTMDQATQEPIFIERRGQASVVMVNSQLFEKLLEDAEELEDIRLFDEAIQEEGNNIPWEQVLEDLGWE